MNLFQGLLYGIISGISHFLPVPSLTNQSILLKLFGVLHRDHLCDAIVHICVLISLIMCTRGLLEQVRYDSRRRLVNHTKSTYLTAERRFSKNASYCSVFLMIVFILWMRLTINYLLVSIFLIVNGLLLYMPSRMYSGNKDARSMSLLDSILFGAANALSAVPGFSGVGCSVSIATMRGADRQRIVNWVLMLGLPTLIALIGADIILLITNWKAITFGSIWGYLFAGIFAYIGGYFSIVLLKSLAKRAGFHGFAFYSWGLALLMLILFLI